jgi:predicted signal transduction protein with EAL and GGDEF domain
MKNLKNNYKKAAKEKNPRVDSFLFLEIDRSFINSITDESDELAIVKAINYDGSSMNLNVIAEGVKLGIRELSI